jgi:hypothetical protein
MRVETMISMPRASARVASRDVHREQLLSGVASWVAWPGRDFDTSTYRVHWRWSLSGCGIITPYSGPGPTERDEEPEKVNEDNVLRLTVS